MISAGNSTENCLTAAWKVTPSSQSSELEDHTNEQLIMRAMTHATIPVWSRTPAHVIVSSFPAVIISSKTNQQFPCGLVLKSQTQKPSQRSKTFSQLFVCCLSSPRDISSHGLFPHASLPLSFGNFSDRRFVFLLCSRFAFADTQKMIKWSKLRNRRNNQDKKLSCFHQHFDKLFRHFRQNPSSNAFFFALPPSSPKGFFPRLPRHPSSFVGAADGEHKSRRENNGRTRER